MPYIETGFPHEGSQSISSPVPPYRLGDVGAALTAAPQMSGG